MFEGSSRAICENRILEKCLEAIKYDSSLLNLVKNQTKWLLVTIYKRSS